MLRVVFSLTKQRVSNIKHNKWCFLTPTFLAFPAAKSLWWKLFSPPHQTSPFNPFLPTHFLSLPPGELWCWKKLTEVTELSHTSCGIVFIQHDYKMTNWKNSFLRLLNLSEIFAVCCKSMFRLEVIYMFLADGVINNCNILPWTITIGPSVQSLEIKNVLLEKMFSGDCMEDHAMKSQHP